MTDHFAVLGLPRSAWLDAEELKAKFLDLGSRRHPDAAGGSAAAFAELNAAWQALREPAGCLRHFLELEHPASLATTAQTPPELADLFMEIASLRQAAQKLGAKLAEASSPLTKALLEPERVEIRGTLDRLEAKIGARTAQIVADVRDGSATTGVLAAALASLTFLRRWSAQLTEMRLGVDGHAPSCH